jgi:hypothetical protein
MVDIGALALAIVLIVMASNPRWQIQVGKHRLANASGNLKFAVIFPLGATISIVAVARLIGVLDAKLCPACSRITYGLVLTPYVGWVLTFIGLLGVKSFSTIRRPISRALVVIGIICGPLLLGTGFFEIVVRLRK